jgi:hypothetical protein
MLLAGASLDSLPGPKYLAALRFAEVSLRAPLPRAATLRQKRGQAPDNLVLALRAPKTAMVGAKGPLRFDAELEAGLAWLLAARDALAAKLVVLATPADLTPGARSRELLAAYVDKLPRDPARPFVWAPHGAWERDQAERIASDLGLVLAFDPLEEDCPEGPIAYARLVAIGARRSFSPALLEDALESIPAHLESYAVIESERAFPQASILQKIAAGQQAEIDPADLDDEDEDGEEGGEDDDAS